MPKVFISYSHHDIDFRRRLAVALRRAGIETWVDREDIPFGDWRDQIEGGIQEAEWFLVIQSAFSRGRPEVLKEVESASRLVEQGKLRAILPVVIDGELEED